MQVQRQRAIAAAELLRVGVACPDGYSHHWVIAQDGRGVCKRCQAERQFATLFEAVEVERRMLGQEAMARVTYMRVARAAEAQMYLQTHGEWPRDGVRNS